MTRPRIAYLCDVHPDDSGSYSGGNARLRRLLQEKVGDVTVLDPGWGAAEPLRRLLARTPPAIELRARWRLRLLVSRAAARHVARQLAEGPENGQGFDVLFCAYSFHSLHGLRPPRSVVAVFSSDATPTAYKRSPVGASFGSYIAASRLLDPLILRAERSVFRSCDLLLWPSRWLKESVDALCGLDDSTSRVLPWGANVATPPRESLNLAPSLDGKLRLLLLGRDWTAKGGPRAVAALDALREGGTDARLTVVGCVPPEADRREAMTIHPYLDKSDPDQRATLEGLLRDSHFLLMPSYESYGFAFCEASAWALPSLCLRVGGVPVEDGVNGHALPEDATGADFAALIRRLTADPEGYSALRRSARARFEDRLNWDAWAEGLRAALAEKAAEKGRAPG